MGKTSLIQWYTTQRYHPTVMTPGASFHALEVSLPGTDIPLRVNVWDTGGQERYAQLTQNYARGAAVALVAFDLTDRSTFDKLPARIKSVQDVEPHCRFVLVGNKLDIVEDQPTQRDVSHAEATAYAQSLGAAYFETSARTGIRVKEAFETAFQQAAAASEDPDSSEDDLPGVAAAATVALERTSAEASAQRSSKDCAC